MKKITILFTLISIFISGYSYAASAHDIHIEWTYSQPSDSRVLAGYNLYMEGVKVCTSNSPADSAIDCIVQAEDGTHEFTLTSFFTDGSETSHSSPYSFVLESTSEPDLVAAIATSPVSLSGDIPFSVSFNGTNSTGNITSYGWAFGDSGSGSGSQISHTYKTPGIYTATLTTTGPAGTSQDSVTVTVSTPPVPPSAVISSSSLSGDAPLNVSFNGSGSTGDIISYSWTFGDSGSGSGSQVSHSYTTSGTYTATLTTTGPAGTSQDSVTVTVSTPPVPPSAVISSSSLSGDAPLNVSFNGSGSTGDISAYSWTFGDSGSGSGGQVSHSYTTPGTYTATLITTGPAGTSQDSVTVTVSTPPVPPSAVISSSSLSGDAPLNVSFNGSGSTGDISSYSWTFGDSGTGSGSQVSHSYTTPGTFTATLITNGPAGTSQKSVTVNVASPTTPPSAVISSTALTGNAPFSVSFDGSGSIGASSYSWSFGDGDSSSLNQIIHVYSVPGTYNASLTVTNSLGQTHQATVTVIVNISVPSNTPPNAVISSSTAVGEAPFAITFDGSGSSDSEGAIATYSWSFGDGATATGINAVYTYSTPGSYTASLTVTDSQNVSDSITTPVIITEPTTPNEPPVAAVTASEIAGSIPLEVTFSGASSSDPEDEAISYSWNFGDGSTAQGVSAVHTFTTVGAFTVSLTVTDDGGASSTTTTTITTDELTPTFHIELDDIEIDHNWVRIDFAEPFVDPVVVAGPLSSNGSHPSIIRLRNISSSGFEIRLQEWEYLDGSHSLEKVSYLAMEKGRHTLEGGTQIEAGNFQASGGSKKDVQFTTVFSEEPVLITSLQSFADTKAATSRIKSISDTEFSVSIEEEELSTVAHDEETIGYIAWEPVNTTIGNMKVIADRTSKAVKHKWYTINYGEQLTESPLFLAAMSPQVGGNTASIRYTNKTDSSIQVKVEEEQSKDSEVRHSRETVGYFIFSLSGE